MKIDDCILEAEYVVLRSPARHTPEQEWVDANKKSTVPEFDILAINDKYETKPIQVKAIKGGNWQRCKKYWPLWNGRF